MHDRELDVEQAGRRFHRARQRRPLGHDREHEGEQEPDDEPQPDEERVRAGQRREGIAAGIERDDLPGGEQQQLDDERRR